MSLVVNTNVSSITAQRNLTKTTNALSRAYEHLSTGSRISRAADDAAGLGIASRLNSQVRSLDQAVRNANDGISLVQTADGGLGEVEGVLVRMRELSVQSANGTLSDTDKDNLQTEFSQLQATVDQIANGTTFNGIDLLNASSAITLQIGAGTTVGVDTLDVSTTAATGSDLSIDTLDIGSTGDASAAIAAIDTALNTVTSARATFGAYQNRLSSAVSNLQVRSENLSSAKSRILDADIATETANLTKFSILQQAGLSVLAQANQAPGAALSLL